MNTSSNYLTSLLSSSVTGLPVIEDLPEVVTPPVNLSDAERKPELPKLSIVILHNDNSTGYDFVTRVISAVFG